MALMATALLLGCCGCSDSKGDYAFNVDYLPVQLPGSERWSIIDVNSGELVARDTYEGVPSAVIGGMFYVMNDNGTYDCYDVASPTKRVNAESYGSVTPFSEDGYAVASLRGGPLTVIDRTCRVVATLPRTVTQC